MHVAPVKHGMVYSSWRYDFNVDDFYWIDVMKRLNRSTSWQQLCVREPVIFVYTFYTEIRASLELQATLSGIGKTMDFDTQFNHKEQFIITEMVTPSNFC